MMMTFAHNCLATCCLYPLVLMLIGIRKLFKRAKKDANYDDFAIQENEP
jgi:hypothetical protein